MGIEKTVRARAEEFVRTLTDDGVPEDRAHELTERVEELVREEIAAASKPVPAKEGINDPCTEPNDVKIVHVRRKEGNTTYVYGGVHCGGCGTTHYFPFSKHTCIAIGRAVERLDMLKGMMWRMQGAARRADAPCSIYDQCERGVELIDGVLGDIKFLDHEEDPDA